MDGYTSSLRMELNLLQRGQKAVLILPSYTATPIFRSSVAESASNFPSLAKIYQVGAEEMTSDKKLKGMQTAEQVGQEIARVALVENPRARYIIEKNLYLTLLHKALPNSSRVCS